MGCGEERVECGRGGVGRARWLGRGLRREMRRSCCSVAPRAAYGGARGRGHAVAAGQGRGAGARLVVISLPLAPAGVCSVPVGDG